MIQEEINRIRQKAGAPPIEQVGSTSLSLVDRLKLKMSETKKLTTGNQFAQPEQKGFFAKTRDFATSIIGGGKLAEGAGMAIAAPSVQKGLSKEQDETFALQQKLLQTIRTNRTQGKDTSRLEKALKQSQGLAEILLDAQQDFIEALPTNKEVIGSALRLAGTAGAGTLVGLGAKATALGKATGFVSGALRGAGAGAISGAGTGAIQGVGLGLEENKSAKDIAISGGLGAAGGAIVGGAVGTLAGGITGSLKGRALRKQQLLDDLTNNPKTIAKYNLEDTGKIVQDKPAMEMIRQGLPERQVAVVKNASLIDKSKFQKMFGLAEKASKDAKTIERPSDVVGESIVERTKHLVSKLKTYGQQVDVVASNLKGKQVNFEPAVQSFLDDLTEMGVKFEKGKPIFVGSDIEGIKPAETLIARVLDRMKNVSDDAYELHKLKKFIDEQVTFGRTGEGLTGRTETILKSLRRGIDGMLDKNFSNYDNANQSYRLAINLLDDTKSILGKNFDPSVGSVRAGAVARRILGNSANRGDILEYLQSVDDFYRTTGGKMKDDIITQTIFADILEDVFGTQATTGLQGQVQRAVEQVGGVAQDVAQGQPLAALTRGAIRVYQATRDINNKAKIEALRKLIGLVSIK